MNDAEPDRAVRNQADWRDYARIARFDHVTKHVFIVPGLILAALLRPEVAQVAALLILPGFVSAVALAPANYVINEWLDGEFDRYHPEKSQCGRPEGAVRAGRLCLVYRSGPRGAGLRPGRQQHVLRGRDPVPAVGRDYNVRPARTKDVVFLDVLTDSINNPLRLMLGRAMIDPTSLPPASLLLSYWFGGGFLMNAKRLAEFRDIVAEQGQARLALYRRSFRDYTERRLHVASLLYALFSIFFLAVFLIKYKVEYLIVFPARSFLFAEYLILALKANSVARRPEALLKANRIMVLVAVTWGLFVLASMVEIPILTVLVEQSFIELPVRETPP